MMTLLKKEATKENVNASENFEKYVKEQRSNTTFNGKTLAPFTWYMKALGLN